MFFGVSYIYNVSLGMLCLHLEYVHAWVLQIVGFSISGKVLDSPNGRPLSGAKVYLNKRQIAVTKSDGIYLLEKVRAGLYKLHVEAGIHT